MFVGHFAPFMIRKRQYLKMNIDGHLKFIMTCFRLGISDIAIHIKDTLIMT